MFITGELQDRMETFVLSETLKYLYLLFDEENELHKSGSDVVFSTEAHPMWLPQDVRSKYKRDAKFSGATYSSHLKTCYKRDRELRAKENSLSQRIVGFARSVFSQEQAEEELANLTRNNEISNEVPGVCPIMPRHTNDYDTWYSPLLSKYNRLFEIDSRYNATLIKPPHMQHYRAIELEPEFYSRWSNPRFSTCQIEPTTEIFELLFDLPGLHQQNPLIADNGTITFKTFGGRSRLKIEKLQIYQTDYYGELNHCINVPRYLPPRHLLPHVRYHGGFVFLHASLPGWWPSTDVKCPGMEQCKSRNTTLCLFLTTLESKTRY